jgi:outer membrane biosynthesis protein TonB
VIDDKEYMASAMLYSDSEELLGQVKTAVYSFQVLEDKEVVKPEEATETPEATKEPTATPEPTVEATLEPTPEATPEPTPEATPEPTPQATPQPTEPTPAPVNEVVTPMEGSRACISPAYVRSGPNNQSPVVGTVVEGDTITITGEIRNWYEINYGGAVAYVCKDYIG